MMINTQGVLDTDGYSRKVKQLIDEVAVYPVSCEQLSGGRSDREWLEAVLAGGARMVQLRDKVSPDNVLLEKARYFREKTAEAGAIFLVNDRVDIALIAGSDGVHVGQDDLPPWEIRRLAPDMIVGLSCNSENDVHELGDDLTTGRCGVTYYNVGPIYQTGTKEGLHSFLGPDAIPRFTRSCPLPFTVMGGIKLSHVAELVSAGARRIAVVTAISQAEDMVAETARWQKTIEDKKKTAAGEGGVDVA